ncbi:MAG: PKD domain containing protein [Candidatus Peregrinibacteria bacterium GW2011_GWA2_47_7]|nr:MAG: PKD domain containing protein [Candidatus Peregrinibacteria bacterium GW2011_GWA2_47_7]
MYFLLIVLLILSQIPYAMAQDSPQLPSILINEIAAFEPSTVEWIEIFNTTESPIDITGWSFFENETKHRLSPATNDLIIEPAEYALIVNSVEDFNAAYPDFTGTIIDSSWSSLSEDGEIIGLLDNTDIAIELFTYPAISQKVSLERVDETTWRENPDGHSMGAQNIPEITEEEQTEPVEKVPEEIPTVIAQETEEVIVPTITDEVAPPATDQNPTTEEPSHTIDPLLLINEVSFKDSTGDWIELFMADDRNGGNGFDIGGLTIEADSVIFTLPPESILKTGEFLLFEGAKLTATSEQIFITTPGGEILDAVCWSNGTLTESEQKDLDEIGAREQWTSNQPESCHDSVAIPSLASIGRISDIDTNTKDDWKIFAHPTRGVKNEVMNQAPIPQISIQSGSTAGKAPLSINVTAELSLDPDHDPLMYFWDFGDGAIHQNENPPSHTYTNPGRYTILLRVEDRLEATAETTLPIEVTIEHNTTAIKPAETVSSKPPEPVQKSVETKASIEKSALPIEHKNVPTKQPAAQHIVKNVAPTTTKASSRTLPALHFNTTETVTDTTATAPTVKAKKTPATEAAGKKTKTATKAKRISYKNGQLSSAIKITEVMPNPDGPETEEEWIEITNEGVTAVNFGNWYITDLNQEKKDAYVLPDTLMLEPGAATSITRADSKIALNNNKDSVYLFDFQDQLIDEVSYENAKSNMSYALVSVDVALDATPAGTEREDQWQWTADATPGEKNPRYAILHGTVNEMLPQENAFLLETSDGARHKIVMAENTFDTAWAPLALKPDSSIDVVVKKRADDIYALQKIQNIVPADSDTKKESGKFPWITVFIALLLFTGSIINVVMIRRSLQSVRIQNSI